MSKKIDIEQTSDEILEQFDLSVKKKKKKINILDDNKNKINDNTINITGNKDDNSENAENADYDYVYLLDRLYNNIRENNPNLMNKKKYIIELPEVVKYGSRKVIFVNFASIVSSINRKMDHVKSFICTELQTQCSIDALNRLIIKGRYTAKHLTTIIQNYIIEYVSCKSCKSIETVLLRDLITRLFTVKCDICKSTRTIEKI